MPKAKKKRIPHYNHHDAPRNSQRGGGGGSAAVGKGKKMHTFSRLSSSGKDGSSKTLHNNNQQQKNQQQQKQHVRPMIPFGRRDRILLIGEGMYLSVQGCFFLFFDLSILSPLVYIPVDVTQIRSQRDMILCVRYFAFFLKIYLQIPLLCKR